MPLTTISEIITEHREHADGTGFPKGLTEKKHID